MSDTRLEIAFHQCLGKGGFGEVYLATVHRAGGLAKRMAVKVLHKGLDGESDAVQRLRDEGRMLAILDHPAILRVHELTRVQGRVALITEYIEGMDLVQCTRPGKLLPPRVAVGVIGEVASALEAAWTTVSPDTGRPLQLVHRDIKPENVRLTVHGQVKLLDFGIARTTEVHRHARTRAGDLPFTPGYAAPETFRRSEQGPATDIYALGVTLYRLLTGERLYGDMEVGEQFATAALPEVYAPWVTERLALVKGDPRLVELVTRMLAYEKGERPTATEVRETCELLEDELSGPSLTRWARATSFPPPREVGGAELTGRTVMEDTPEEVAPPAAHAPPPRAIRRADTGRAQRRSGDVADATPQRTPTPRKPTPQPTPQRTATPKPTPLRASQAPPTWPDPASGGPPPLPAGVKRTATPAPADRVSRPSPSAARGLHEAPTRPLPIAQAAEEEPDEGFPTAFLRVFALSFLAASAMVMLAGLLVALWFGLS